MVRSSLGIQKRLFGRKIGEAHSGGAIGSVRPHRTKANLVERHAGYKGGWKRLR